MGPPLRARRGRAGTWDPQMLAGRVARPRRFPAPGRASGTLPVRRWPPPGAPRPPSPSCPPGSPRAGGGNRPRRDSASQAAGSLGGGSGARREGASDPVCGPALLRSVGHRRGAPAGGGAAAGIVPRGSREGPRGPSGARGRVGAVRRGEGLSPWAESRASGCASELSQRSGPGPPWEPEYPSSVSPETGLGCPEAPLAGRLPGVRGWNWSFSNLSSLPSLI